MGSFREASREYVFYIAGVGEGGTVTKEAGVNGKFPDESFLRKIFPAPEYSLK